MAGVEVLGILDDIQVLVSDKLQVVNYKWLSRNYSVSSNDAKRLLQEFVEKHGTALQVIYALSGYLKENPQIYQISLVSGLKLAEVKLRFEDSCSVQVYSVQSCIPNDPAALWNAEFMQAEELFGQPPTEDNCLRDNRFCAVSNSFVKRNATGWRGGSVPQQPKIASGAKLSSKTNGMLSVPPAPQLQQGQVHTPSPKNGLESSALVITDDKTRNNALKDAASSKLPSISTTSVPPNKNIVHNAKSSSAAGGSLANLWGRASAKSKSNIPNAKNTGVAENPVAAAEAQINAHEALADASSEEDEQYVCKRDAKGEVSRKRRVVFDYSDDEDDNGVVSLASPDPPKGQTIPDSIPEIRSLAIQKKNLNFEDTKQVKLDIKKEKTAGSDSIVHNKLDSEACSMGSSGVPSSEKPQNHILEDSDDRQKKCQANDDTSYPKRKKVLKTRVDEKGREVNEVVWEEEGNENKEIEKNAVTYSAENRSLASNKAPVLGNNAPSNSLGKAGNKKMAKGGGKDSKQGNILSFFKKA